MYLHFGKHLFGKCDVVPELFHVETIFFHVDFLPLVPLQSYLVTGKTGKKFNGIKIRMSKMSVFYTWARGGSFIGALILSGFTLDAIGKFNRGDSAPLVTHAILAAGCWLLFAALMLYPRRIKPRYERACELATIANLGDVGWAALNVQYGREHDERPAAAQEIS